MSSTTFEMGLVSPVSSYTGVLKLQSLAQLREVTLVTAKDLNKRIIIE